MTGLAISDVLSPADPDDEAPEPWHVDRVRGCALSPLFPIKVSAAANSRYVETDAQRPIPHRAAPSAARSTKSMRNS